MCTENRIRRAYPTSIADLILNVILKDPAKFESQSICYFQNRVIALDTFKKKSSFKKALKIATANFPD